MPNDRLEIAAGGIGKLGRGRKRLIGDICKQTPVAIAFAEPLSDLTGQRRAEIGMIENRGR